jgi:rod shape-determining protein MreD
MNWAAFTLAAAAALTLDASFMPVLRFAGTTPSLVGCVAAFVALHADRRRAWWGCWLLGLLLDFSSPVAVGDALGFVPGPHAMGFTFGAAAILSLRSEVMRRSMVASSAGTFLLLLGASLVWTALWIVRGLWPDAAVPWVGNSAAELGHQALDALASGILAIPVSWLLGRTFDHWGFPASRRRR